MKRITISFLFSIIVIELFIVNNSWAISNAPINLSVFNGTWQNEDYKLYKGEEIYVYATFGGTRANNIYGNITITYADGTSETRYASYIETFFGTNAAVANFTPTVAGEATITANINVYHNKSGMQSGTSTKTVFINEAKKNVTFKDYDGTVLKTEKVEEGKSATAPENPIREGYTFIKWDKNFSNITEDIIVTAEYSINTYNVIFKDYDGTVLKTEEVEYGKSATAPKNPTRKGYTFTKWDKDFSNITSDLTVTAVYTKKQSSDIDITPYMFNAKFYADTNPDVKKAFGNNEAELRNHYYNFGIKEGRQATPIFNPVYYLDNNNDVKQVFGNNYESTYNHFVQFGAKEGRTASREFSVKYYLEMNEDVANAVDYNYTRAIEHYVLFGINEGRLANNSPINITPYLFDADLYYSLYADLQNAIGNNENSLRNHFINWGCSEGRIASYVFDSKYYLDNNADVKQAFGNNYKQAYEHFINYGINEGRVGSKYFDAKYYLEKNEDLKNVFKTNYSKALEHFVQYGINEGRLASKTFNVKAYKNKNADLSKEFGNNWKQYFKHYMIWGQKENRECV